jgi:transcription termination/antitermination protein NusA
VEQRQLEQREVGRAKRLKAMEKVRPTIPAGAFQMELKELELADDITQALKNITNVGELMVRLQADEDNLRLALDSAKAGNDAMDAIKESIASLVIAEPTDIAPPVEVVEEKPAPAIEAEAPKEPEIVAAPAPAEAVTEAVAEKVGATAEDEEAPPAFIDDVRVAEPEADKAKPRRLVPKPVTEVEPVVEAEGFVADGAEEGDEKDKKGKKGKNRRRELVFDERRGEVVAKRKRKGGRARDWTEFEE